MEKKTNEIFIAVIGSSQIHEQVTRNIIYEICPRLKELSSLTILTGGTLGPPYLFSKAFEKHRVKHLLPIPFKTDKAYLKKIEHGEVFFYGGNMDERQNKLIELADFVIMFEGGPGTVSEASKAILKKKPVFSFPATGGASTGLFFDDSESSKYIQSQIIKSSSAKMFADKFMQETGLFSWTGSCKVQARANFKAKKSNTLFADIILENPSSHEIGWTDENGLINTEMGVKVFIQAMCKGIVTVAKMAEVKQLMSTDDAIDYAIANMNKTLQLDMQVSEGNWEG